jgi:uncharacterized protein
MGSPQPWQVLSGLPAWQITEIPRPGLGLGLGEDGDWGGEERVAAFASAYGCGGPVAVGWVRDRPGGPVRVLTAGAALVAGADAGEAVLTVPSGARGGLLREGEAARALAALPCWTRIAGVSDVLLAEARAPRADQQMVPLPLSQSQSLERGLLSAWLDAFGWLLLAEPVDPDAVTEMAAEAASAQLEAEQNNSPRARLAARRAAARHDELREARTSGLWQVHLLAGAATPDAAARVARLVASSADLRGLPYGLAPRPVSGSLPDTLIAVARGVGGGGGGAGGGAPGRALSAVPGPGDDRSWWDAPMSAGPWGGPVPGPGPGAGLGLGDGGRRWPQPAPGLAPAEAFRQAEDSRDTLVPGSPFFASTRLVAALARTPGRELPGLRFTLRPDFDVTPETGVDVVDGAVPLGAVLDRNRVPAGPLALPRSSLNRHVFVCGATGAGKSQTVRGLLEAAAQAGIPWLVVEPAKAEYRLMAARGLELGVICIRPGDLSQPAAGINPLEPAVGPDGSRFPLQTHADLLRALFLAAFQADEPFPQVLSAALSKCYEQAGWDLVTGQAVAAGVPPSYPGLEDLQAAALAVVDEAGYGREVRDNVRGFVTVRIGSLRLGTTGRFLDGGHPIDFAALLENNVVLEIEDAGDDHDKAFLMGAILVRLTEHLRLRHRYDGSPAVRLRHLTVIEEAHRLLRQPPPGAVTGPAAHAVELFADLLAEIRAYGEGLIIAEQIPAKLIPDVIKNTAVKIVHRLPAADDRDAVGATMNLRPAQSEYLVTLRPGEAAVHTDGMDYPLLVRMPDGTSREQAVFEPAPIGPVIARRSLTCGADCLDRPCTLAQMRAVQRAAITDPRITMWAELAVVAHLTGWEMPRPAKSFAAALRKMDVRLRDCAISHAADAAVAARAAAISARVSPMVLAVHVGGAMRQFTVDQTSGCGDEEPQYLAPPYRWSLVLEALQAAAGTTAARHPDSDQWERTYGKPVPGRTAAHQYRAVLRWYQRDQRDTVAAVLWGSRPHTAIEQAVGTPAGSDDWPGEMAEALRAFTTMTWPRTLLARSPARKHTRDE